LEDPPAEQVSAIPGKSLKIAAALEIVEQDDAGTVRLRYNPGPSLRRLETMVYRRRRMT
jgi:hypothetical protein